MERTARRLYNICEVCDAIIANEDEKALGIFNLKAEAGINEVNMFLHLMNCAMYNLILHRTGVSLYECHDMIRDEVSCGCPALGLCEWGKRIIDAYCKCVHCKKRCCKYIDIVTEYIENNISDELSLDRLARSIYVSKCYLSRIFSAHMDITISDYIKKRRIHHAKNLLAHTALSLDEIASHSGFSSLSYFSTVFKRNEGITPTEYRQIAARNRQS